MRNIDKSFAKTLSVSCVMAAGLVWGAAATAQPAFSATPAIAQSVHIGTPLLSTPQQTTAQLTVLGASNWKDVKRISARKTVQLRRYLRRSLKQTAAKIPGMQSLKWADRNMGTPAILLILAMLSAFGLLMMSGPLSRTGGHH